MLFRHRGMLLADDRLLPAARRVWELDFLRGVFILLMLMDHTFFDIAGIFGAAWTFSGVDGAAKAVVFCTNYWDMPLRRVVHDGVLWGFFAMCGISTTFTHNNLLRVGKLAACAMILTCATVFAEKVGLAQEIAVRFGVLHMLCIACLLTGAIHSVTRSSRLAAVLVPALLAMGLYLFNLLYLEVAPLPDYPEWLCIVGVRMGDYATFSPGDYFPLLSDIGQNATPLAFPYAARVLAGLAIAPLLYPVAHSRLPRLEGAWCRPICFLGRHTLWIVLVHQLVIPLVLALVTGWFITPGDYVLF